MDLKTSRRPPPVPRFCGEFSGPGPGLDTLTELERRVASSLDLPRLPDELVGLVGAKRLAVQSAVARLNRGFFLDTPRGRHARAFMDSPWRVGVLPLGPDEAAQIGDAQRQGLRALGQLGAAADLGEVLDALAAPLVETLDRRWSEFVDSERFARRAAFGLPDEPEPDQASRFSRALMSLMVALSQTENERLARIVDGQAMTLSIKEVEEVEAWLAESYAHEGDVVVVTASVASRVALGEAGTSPMGGPRMGLSIEIFVHDRRCLLGRSGPRPLPFWLVERDSPA